MKKKQSFVIPGTLIQLNDYIRAERSSTKGRFIAAKIKRESTEYVTQCILAAGIKPITTETFFVFRWTVKDRRKDKDNIAFAKKFILDGLVEAGILPNDGWEYVGGWTDEFYINATECVSVDMCYD